MKNLEQALALASKAVDSLPDDYSLMEARRHLRMAVNHLQKEKSKRGKNERKMTAHEKWRLDLETSSIVSTNPDRAKEQLKVIEAMIEEEENKAKERKAIQDEKIRTILG